MPEFSIRQAEVLELMKEGRSNKEIAVLLGISVRTVEMHRAKVLKKAGIPSHQQMVKEKLEKVIY